METMKQWGLWSSLGTHGSLQMVIWWLCISNNSEARKFYFSNRIWPWKSIAPLTIEIFTQGCHEVGRKKNRPDFPWHFPADCQHKLQSLSRYIPCGEFLQYIQNHIEISLFINRCFNIVVLKRVSTRERFQHHENCWYLVPNIMQNMTTNKV